MNGVPVLSIQIDTILTKRKIIDQKMELRVFVIDDK